ncbi:hypothetical protein V8E54_003901 [Elaphomyces granulatus]
MHHLLALILSLLPLALGQQQTPFPIAFKLVNPSQSSALSTSASSYFSSLEQQPAFTSFAKFMSTATNLTGAEQAEFALVTNNPALLGNDFFTASTTPAWYTDIATPLRSYVSSVASVEASIATNVVGTGVAGRVEAKVAVMSSLLATILAVILLL